MTTENLWPQDLFASTPRAPVSILREQAQYLTKASGGDIRGEILTERGRVYSQWGHSEGDESDVIHRFQLEVPAIGGYTFDLFTASHGPRALYPVRIEYSLGDLSDDITFEREEQYTIANDGTELTRALKAIFGNRATRSVMQTLKAQVIDPDAIPPAPPEPSHASLRDSNGEPEDDDIPF